MRDDQEKAFSLRPTAIEVMQTERSAEPGGGNYGGSPTGEGSRPIQPGSRQPKRRAMPSASTRRSPELPTPEYRAAFRLHWRNAQASAEAMAAAAGAEDRMSLGIAADELDKCLGELWELRNIRDIDWQTILNHMQGLMRAFFLEKRAEYLTVEQCKNIATLVKDYLGPATKTIDDLNEVLRLIDDTGFDPYAAISADPLSEEVE